MSKTKSNFRMPYDNLGEIEMRLHNTVVTYDGNPVKVIVIRETREIGKFDMTLADVDGNVTKATYPDDKFDLSPFLPMYTNFGHYANNSYWMYRKVMRQYQQGANNRNTMYGKAGGTRVQGIDPNNILKAVSNPLPVIRFEQVKDWNHKMSFALSPHVAIFHKINEWGDMINNELWVEYHGETIGKIPDKTKNFLETDNESLSLNPWCRQRLEEVGLETR